MEFGGPRRDGSGPGLVQLHGWPHTRRIWDRVIPALARNHLVIAPDLRGLGDSARPRDGYDAATLAADLAGLLDSFDLPAAAILALDASVPAAFLFALRHPERVHRLVLMESLLAPLPGAEEFLAAGPPWWFGFHAVPGLAETVLVGHEAEYIDWFLTAGTTGPDRVPADLREAVTRAYTGPEALRGGSAYYRAMPENARLIATAVADSRLRVPTLALGADSVGSALYRQLSTVADDLVGRLIPECGHIIPLDHPDALLAEVVPFLR